MRVTVALAIAGVLNAAPLHSQTNSLSRSEAIQTALERGPRLGTARADTMVAGAQLIGARALPNPTVNAGYSRAVPRYHVSVDVPVDYPRLRQLRIQSAG